MNPFHFRTVDLLTVGILVLALIFYLGSFRIRFKNGRGIISCPTRPF